MSNDEVETGGNLDPDNPDLLLDIMAVAECSQADAKKLLKRLMSTLQRLEESQNAESSDISGKIK